MTAIHWQERQKEWQRPRDPAKEENLAQYRNGYNLRGAIHETVRIMAPSMEVNNVEFEKEVLHYLKRITDALETLSQSPDPTLAHPSAVDGALSFIAEKLTANVNEGKTYWKVQGGQFTKFGVTVWPEVLAAAGFNPDDLNPMKPVDLAGWTAHYILNEEGKAHKVVRLERPQETTPAQPKQNGRQAQPAQAAAPPAPPDDFLDDVPPAPMPQVTDGGRKQDLEEVKRREGILADLRANIEGAEGTVTLGYIADRAEMAGLFPNRHDALKKMGEFDFPPAVKIEFAQRISVKGGLQVWDWMVESVVPVK